MAICQPAQAACKTKHVKQKSVAEGPSSIVHVLFIPAAVAEGGILVRVIYSSYSMGQIPGIVFTQAMKNIK